jgi:hypothetical protein
MVLETARQKLEAFVAGGGRIEVVPPPLCRAKDWNKLLDAIPEGAAAQRGRFMIYASGEQGQKYRSRAGLITARDYTGAVIGGAMVHADVELVLERLGSDGSLPGIGTALLIGVAQCAKAKPVSFIGFPIWDSEGFWTSLGAEKINQRLEWSAAARQQLIDLGVAVGLPTKTISFEL